MCCGQRQARGVSGLSSWVEASGLVLGTSGAIVKKFRDCNQAVEFVKACWVPKSRQLVLKDDEGPPDGSSDWSVKSAKGAPNLRSFPGLPAPPNLKTLLWSRMKDLPLSQNDAPQ